MSKLLSTLVLLLAGLALSGHASAATVNLNSPEWLGSLKLGKAQLTSIRKAFVKALNASIDDEQQCGEVRLDCVVRAAREWKVDGDTYREMVIHIHTVGHASRAVGQNKGKWPKIVAK